MRGDVAPMNKYVLHGQQGTQADRQAGRREHSRGVRRVLELLGVLEHLCMQAVCKVHKLHHHTQCEEQHKVRRLPRTPFEQLPASN